MTTRKHAAAMLKITQVHSRIGNQERVVKVLTDGLGLGRIGRSVVVVDNPYTRGMITKVAHIVRVESLGEAPAPSRPVVAPAVVATPVAPPVAVAAVPKPGAVPEVAKPAARAARPAAAAAKPAAAAAKKPARAKAEPKAAAKPRKPAASAAKKPARKKA